MDTPRHRKASVGRAGLLLACLWAGGCERPAGAPAPSHGVHPDAPVVLISIDTLRSDRLPIYGYGGVETPAIDALRADAILYERAYSHYPLTLPSHVTLLTGQLPTGTGVRDNAGYRLRPEFPTHLPHLLKRAGYPTGGAVSSYVIRASTGIAQGFDRYDDAVDETGGSWGPERDGAETVARALEWLDTVTGSTFFLFVHLYEPHLPHEPPEPFRSRYGDTYDAEIATADARVGELVEALRQRGFYDDALIVLVSDHGEGLQDHQEEGHGIFLYREAIQVPLVVKLPGGERAGTSVEPAVRLIDVAPSILKVLGLDVPAEMAGGSLLEVPESLGDSEAEKEAPVLAARRVYSETMYPRTHYGWSELASLIDGRFHYIEAPEPELYDLESDPAERNNLLADERGIYREMRDALARMTQPLDAPVAEDEETLAQLAALGYVGTSRSTEGSLLDPKIGLARSAEAMRRAFDLFGRSDFEGAAAAFRALTEENPQMTDAWRHLGMSLMELGRSEDALAALERAFELSLGSAELAAQVGTALLELGRIEEAKKHMELAGTREPVLAAELGVEIALAEGDLEKALVLSRVTSGADQVTVATRRLVGLALLERGRLGEAVELLRRLAEEAGDPPSRNALARALLTAERIAEAEPIVEGVLAEMPENAVALEHRGLIALHRGRPAVARDALRRAVGLNDGLANAWNLLGVALFQLRDVPGALDAWEKSVAIDPQQWDSLYNLGFTAARTGQRERARRALRQYVETAPSARYAREIAEARRLLAQMGA